MNKPLPKIIKDVGFDFHWSIEKVWLLDVSVEDISVDELKWHFDIPFWSSENGFYDLRPLEVINDPKKWKKDYDRAMASDLKYPLDIMFWKNNWLLLDGLHRLVKANVLGIKTVKIRKIPVEAIPQITK